GRGSRVGRPPRAGRPTPGRPASCGAHTDRVANVTQPPCGRAPWQPVRAPEGASPPREPLKAKDRTGQVTSGKQAGHGLAEGESPVNTGRNSQAHTTEGEDAHIRLL